MIYIVKTILEQSINIQSSLISYFFEQNTNRKTKKRNKQIEIVF